MSSSEENQQQQTRKSKKSSPSEEIEEKTARKVIPPAKSVGFLTKKNAAPAAMKSRPGHGGSGAAAGGRPSYFHARGSSEVRDQTSTALVKKARERTQSAGNASSRFCMLNFQMIHRLEEVLKAPLQFTSRQPRMPVLNFNLQQLMTQLKKALEMENIPVKDVRLAGGAAAYVLEAPAQPKAATESSYTGMEVIFSVDCTGTAALNLIRSCMLRCITGFIDDCEGNKAYLTENMIKDAYVHRMIRVSNSTHDCWSLLALGNPLVEGEKIVELKFVSRMKRPFEFTVDSFQIVVDSMLSFIDKASQPLSQHFYPPVVGESTAGNFEEALQHLHQRLIATRAPEEIRGGGLLKYCHLLVEGYRAEDPHLMPHLERYMCSRFFIDFPDLSSQLNKLEVHMSQFYGLKTEKRLAYLRTLRRIIDKSTVCLTLQERRRTLNLLDYCIQRASSPEGGSGNTENSAGSGISSSVIELEEFNRQHWSLDQVFYGTSYFPQEVYIQYTLPASFNPMEGAASLVSGDVNQEDEGAATPTVPEMACHQQSAASMNAIGFQDDGVLVESQ